MSRNDVARELRSARRDLLARADALRYEHADDELAEAAGELLFAIERFLNGHELASGARPVVVKFQPLDTSGGIDDA